MALKKVFAAAVLVGALGAFSSGSLASPVESYNNSIYPEIELVNESSSDGQIASSEKPPYELLKGSLEASLASIPTATYEGITNKCTGTALEKMMALGPAGPVAMFSYNNEPDGREGIFPQVNLNGKTVTYCLSLEQFNEYLQEDNQQLSQKAGQLEQMRTLADSYSKEEAAALVAILDKMQRGMEYLVHARNQAYFAVLDKFEESQEAVIKSNTPSGEQPAPY